MGKKKRYILNTKKFGKKYFKVLDKMDGTVDNKISSKLVDTSIRKLVLTDFGDRTVKLTAQLYGSASAGSHSGAHRMGYHFHVSGGLAAIGTPEYGGEKIVISSSGSTGYLFASAGPALVKDSKPAIFPAGRLRIKATVGDNDGPGFWTTPDSSLLAHAFASVNVSSAPIGLTSTQLGTALSGAAGGAFDGTLDMSLDLAQMNGTGVQHGSGSSVGSSAVYSPSGSAHGYAISASGSLTGSIALAHTGASNGHANQGLVVLLASGSIAALDAQSVTLTFVPLDVNGDQSSDQAVSSVVTVS